MIGSNNYNSKINCDDNSSYDIIDNICYDFINNFKDLRLSNNMNIMIICVI